MDQVKHLKNSVVFRGSAAAFIIKVFSTALALVLQVVLARWLGVENFGEYIYALTWINLFTLVGQGGFQNAGKKYVAIYQGNQPSMLKGFILFSYRTILGFSIIVFLGFYLSTKIVNYGMSASLMSTLLIGSLMLLFNSLTQNTIGILQGFKEIVKGFTPHNILRPVLIIGGVFLIYFWSMQDINAPVTMGINAGSTLFVFLVTLYFMRQYLPAGFGEIRAQYKNREWIRVTIPFFLIASLGFILNRTDILIIGIMLDTSQAGIYAVATRIASLILFGTFAVNAIVAPIIADLYMENKLEQLERTIKKVTRGLVAYALPAFIILVFARNIFLGLFGVEFVSGALPLVILAGANALTAFFGTVMYIMMMTNNQNQAAIIMIMVTVLNAVLNILLIPIFEIIGAAVATGFSIVVWNLAFYLYIRRRLGIDSSPL